MDTDTVQCTCAAVDLAEAWADATIGAWPDECRRVVRVTSMAAFVAGYHTAARLVGQALHDPPDEMVHIIIKDHNGLSMR